MQFQIWFIKWSEKFSVEYSSYFLTNYALSTDITCLYIAFTLCWKEDHDRIKNDAVNLVPHALRLGHFSPV